MKGNKKLPLGELQRNSPANGVGPQEFGPSENHWGNVLGKVALLRMEEDKHGRCPERIEQIDLKLPDGNSLAKRRGVRLLTVKKCFKREGQRCRVATTVGVEPFTQTVGIFRRFVLLTNGHLNFFHMADQPKLAIQACSDNEAGNTSENQDKKRPY